MISWDLKPIISEKETFLEKAQHDQNLKVTEFAVFL